MNSAGQVLECSVNIMTQGCMNVHRTRLQRRSVAVVQMQ